MIAAHHSMSHAVTNLRSKKWLAAMLQLIIMNSRRACISRPAWNANILFNSMHDIERRNKAIRKHFYDLLGKGIPIMQAYSMTGYAYFLSERRIRAIIAQKHAQDVQSTSIKT